MDYANARQIANELFLFSSRVGIPEARRKVIEEAVSKMLELNVIEESKSAWSSPIVLVAKPDNTAIGRFRWQQSQRKKLPSPLREGSGSVICCLPVCPEHLQASNA
ncbi:unnamed protein product [Pleuronectes platessa]|uniref:Uncharacterized protein n=1 Tax=Pleuronectes platessa TaxID=8262 RepID=A0A9N7VHW3_PLEPL|nr:unnamed protein product [Pleuronectes platessa]